MWRICARKHANRAFSGDGARIFGGRWNPPGVAIVYTASTLSLAALELFVNVDPDDFASGLVAIPADVPDDVSIGTIDARSLPRNWRRYPAPESLQAIGAEWFHKSESTLLSVPSAVIPEERNYLINPAHPGFEKLTMGKPQRFTFDARMWK